MLVLAGVVAAGSLGVAAVLDAIPAGIQRITIHSTALGKEMPAQVFIPAKVDPDARLPVLYLFHGRYGDEQGWMGGRIGRPGVGIHDIAQDLIDAGRIRPVIIVSARIDDSYGVDSPPADDGYAHGLYERYIVDELMPAIEARYPISTDPSDRAMAGLSMGGFAALHAAFRYPERFGAVGGLSPAVFLGTLSDRDFIYPDETARREHDPLRLARTAPIAHLRVFLGTGLRDYSWIVQATDALSQRLQERGIRVARTAAPGGHDVDTWRELAPGMLETLVGPPRTALREGSASR